MTDWLSLEHELQEAYHKQPSVDVTQRHMRLLLRVALALVRRIRMRGARG
jgi:hypothetical protein